MREFRLNYSEIDEINDLANSYAMPEIRSKCPLTSLCQLEYLDLDFSLESDPISGEVLDVDMEVTPKCHRNACKDLGMYEPVRKTERRLEDIIRESVGVKKN